MQQNKLPSITDVSDVEGKYVLVRSSLNVPIENNQVQNQFRIVRSLGTIQYLIGKGARVIVVGHIGRDKEETLKPVFDVLQEHIPVIFSDEVTGTHAKEKRDTLKNGEVLLLENVRRDPRELKNDADFARALADLADLYVNDAFAVSHREQASVVGVPSFLPSYFGINFLHEYEELQAARTPKSPSLFILGGAKFETKMPLIEKYLEIYDHVFVGGALANDIFKAQGHEVGDSLVSDVDLKESSLLGNPKLLIPTDVVVTSKDKSSRVTTLSDVHADECIADAGPETINMLELFIRNAKTILWNGPFGNYEAGFDVQTLACAQLIADASGYTVVGGGDTVASIASLNCQNEFNFLSTAGGAMLVFLEHGTLPAINAVMDTK